MPQKPSSTKSAHPSFYSIINSPFAITARAQSPKHHPRNNPQSKAPSNKHLQIQDLNPAESYVPCDQQLQYSGGIFFPFDEWRVVEDEGIESRWFIGESSAGNWIPGRRGL